MKVIRQQKQKQKQFKPVTFEIRCDTLDDLKYLWMRFNISDAVVAKENAIYPVALKLEELPNSLQHSVPIDKELQAQLGEE